MRAGRGAPWTGAMVQALWTRRPWIAGVLALALLQAVAGQTTIKVLHINDHHSYIEEDDFKMDTTAILTGIESVEIKYGGFPRIATLMQQHADGNTLKLHAGDAITGTLWYTLFQGSADAAMMGSVCFDAFALGNHEFDDGDGPLSDFLTDLAETGCNTQVRAIRPMHVDDPQRGGCVQAHRGTSGSHASHVLAC